MINALTELLEHKADKVIKCAVITIDTFPESTVVHLKVNYQLDDLVKFMQAIDLEYHNGYGGQIVFGTVWYTDGTWSKRSEYDGSEWWTMVEYPEIPEVLL